MNGAAITLRTVVRARADDSVAAQVGEDLVLMSIERGAYFGLDGIAAAIWRNLARPITVAALCDVLAGTFEAERDRLERDVLAFLETLRAQALIEAMEA